MVNVLPEAVRWRRNKLSPFPEILLIQVMYRDLLQAYVEELRSNRVASELFNLEPYSGASSNYRHWRKPGAWCWARSGCA